MAEARASSCASTALALDEPLLGTASVVRSWLLIEQPGPWGADALRQSDLRADLAQVLYDRSVTHDVRVLLLRRPTPRPGTATSAADDVEDEEHPAARSRQCFVAHSGPGRQWMEQRRLTAVDEVLDLDLAEVAAGRPPAFGTPTAQPVYLVCTNSRHDPCCGRLGRPTAIALAAVTGGSVWECSHVGGERFAANLVCLPHGLYFGRVEPHEGPRIAAAYERGTIDLVHYRGRAGDPFVVQAAELFARRHHDLRGIDDLRHVVHHSVAPDVVEVVFSTPDGTHLVARVERRADPTARLLTCHSERPGRPWTYALLGLTEE